jgi:hypothetical protein
VSHIILLVVGEGDPPGAEFLSELDFPSHTSLCHRQNMLSVALPFSMGEYAG